jgi:hypothetical protein
MTRQDALLFAMHVKKVTDPGQRLPWMEALVILLDAYEEARLETTNPGRESHD